MYIGVTHRADETGTRFHNYFGICGTAVPDSEDHRLIDSGDIEFARKRRKDATAKIDCKRCIDKGARGAK